MLKALGTVQAVSNRGREYVPQGFQEREKTFLEKKCDQNIEISSVILGGRWSGDIV